VLDAMETGIADAVRTTIRGAGRSMREQEPAALNRVVLAFLKGRSQRPGAVGGHLTLTAKATASSLRPHCGAAQAGGARRLR
jgi:hypothetical protein